MSKLETEQDLKRGSNKAARWATFNLIIALMAIHYAYAAHNTWLSLLNAACVGVAARLAVSQTVRAAMIGSALVTGKAMDVAKSKGYM